MKFSTMAIWCVSKTTTIAYVYRVIKCNCVATLASTGIPMNSKMFGIFYMKTRLNCISIPNNSKYIGCTCYLGIINNLNVKSLLSIFTLFQNAHFDKLLK